ncbi:MAG: hypothetical protein HQL56_09205 [Magnetococcales bacterium]|nr:hypothetical protein [Magnetococcales bacterium]
MTFWNLLVILCFAILYLGVVMVYQQVRRLRDEVRQRAEHIEPEEEEPRLQPVVQHDNHEECARIILEELAVLDRRIKHSLDDLVNRLEQPFEELVKEMRYASRSAPPSRMSEQDMGSNSGLQNKNDAYREAKLLLSNNVDEERVIEETGLTVEEVSLLKRLINQEGKRDLSM